MRICRIVNNCILTFNINQIRKIKISNRYLAIFCVYAKMRMGDNGKFNGKVNGIEGKTPFLIGVAGGTASGKVN